MAACNEWFGNRRAGVNQVSAFGFSVSLLYWLDGRLLNI
jgi:hypothetical protein